MFFLVSSWNCRHQSKLLTETFSNEQQFWESLLKTSFYFLVSGKVLLAQKNGEMVWRTCNQIKLGVG